MTKRLIIQCGLLLLLSYWEFSRGETQAESIPKNMVLIPAGMFQMGSPLDEYGRDFFPFVVGDEILHEVTITQSFYIAETEVTKAEWDEVYVWALNNGYSDLAIGRNGWVGDVKKTHPVTEVSWYDAVKWCNAKSEWMGLIPVYSVNGAVYRTGYSDNVLCDWDVNGYRLPTEAEWEYACRAGTVTAFYTGQLTRLFSPPVDPNLNKAGWYYGNSDNTHPVGQKQANAWGLYDMHGNACEWCWDWYSTSSPFSATDPRGPESGWGRVVRGGSWRDGSRVCRSAFREAGEPSGKYVRSSSLGFRTVISKTPEWKQVIERQPPRPTYGEPPKKQGGKDSLIVVTHGRIPKESGQTDPPNPDWVDEMTNSITAYLTASGLDKWQVVAYKWTKKAWATKKEIRSGKLTDNAIAEGGKLGDYLAAQGWSHIHLIAHSAGGVLIQTATEKIKSVVPNPTVHETFLDPYIGYIYDGKTKLGGKADWSDQYFSQDTETYDELGSWTATLLEHAHNVDVTWLSTHLEKIPVQASTQSGDVSETCYQVVGTHDWPHEFYTKTIPPSAVIGSKGFGFPLSKEAGTWDTLSLKHPIGIEHLETLGDSTPVCNFPSSKLTVSAAPKPDFTVADIIKSTTGTVLIHGIDSINMTVGSPVWVSLATPITVPINFLSFEAEFMDTNSAQGLMSVYWDSDVLGVIDEQAVLPGLQEYRFVLPNRATNGISMLGFRLDAFSNTVSSVLITNVSFGYVGISGQFSLVLKGEKNNGLLFLQLIGPAGHDYIAEASTNLTDWKTLAILVNTNGSVKFTDPLSINAPQRFYRAVVK